METDEFTKTRMKKKLTSIGSKIADAVDMTEEMEKLGTVSGIKLKQAQDEVSELYIAIEEDTIEEKSSGKIDKKAGVCDAPNQSNKKKT